MISSGNQLAIAKLGTQANKGRKQTNCRGTALEILDQSTARKTRHQTQDHTKNQTNEDREEPNKQTTEQTKQGNPIAKRQKD